MQSRKNNEETKKRNILKTTYTIVSHCLNSNPVICGAIEMVCHKKRLCENNIATKRENRNFDFRRRKKAESVCWSTGRRVQRGISEGVGSMCVCGLKKHFNMQFVQICGKSRIALLATTTNLYGNILAN